MSATPFLYMNEQQENAANHEKECPKAKPTLRMTS